MADAKKSRRGTTPEARERQLVALAVDLAEQQMREGTASAQVITHFLKLGSSRESLEQKRLEYEIEMTKAKTSQIANQEQTEKLMQDALAAMSKYRGEQPNEQERRFDD